MEDYSVVWNAVLGASYRALEKGTCVIRGDDGYYIPATDANRAATGKKSAGIARTAASDDNRSFGFQFVGIVGTDLSGLDTGAQDQPIHVNSVGKLARGTGAEPDQVGYCDDDGTAYVLFGRLLPGPAGPPGADGVDGAPGPAGPAPAGTGYVHVTGGILDAAVLVPGVAGNLIYSNGAGDWLALANGANAKVLTIVGGIPAWQALPAGLTMAGNVGDIQTHGASDLAAIAPGAAGTIIQTVAGAWAVVALTAGSLHDLQAKGASGQLEAIATGANGKVLQVVGGVPAWATVVDTTAVADTLMLWSNADVINGTTRLTVSHSTGEVTHTGKPNHSETRSEFHQSDTYAEAWSQWSGVQTTNATQTAFPNSIALDVGYGDVEVTVTTEVTYSFEGDGLQGGNFLKKTTLKRNGGTLVRQSIENFTKASQQEGMIPGGMDQLTSAVDVVATSNTVIDVKVIGFADITVNWSLSVHIQIAKDPLPTGRKLYDFDFTNLSLGFYSAASFLTRTGLTFTRTTASTVQTSASTVIDSGNANEAAIGNIGATLARRGLVIQGNTWNRLTGTAASDRNITANAGLPWTAPGVPGTIVWPSDTPTSANVGGTHFTTSGLTGKSSSYFDVAAGDATNCTWSSWQKGATDMELCMVNAAVTAGEFAIVAATTTWSRLSVSKTSATTRRFFICCEGRDFSAFGGQVAKVRDVNLDFMQLEDGPVPTEAIPTTQTLRAFDALSRATGSTFIAANGQFKFYAKVSPKSASTNQVYWRSATATTGTAAAWFLWSWGANGQNYAKIKDSDKKLYVKIANGVEKVSTNAIAWAAGDQVEIYLAAGNNVASVAKYRINGGAWVDLVLATISDVPAPGAGAIRLFSDDNASTGDAAALMCWVNRITVYDTTAPAGM